MSDENLIEDIMILKVRHLPDNGFEVGMGCKNAPAVRSIGVAAAYLMHLVAQASECGYEQACETVRELAMDFGMRGIMSEGEMEIAMSDFVDDPEDPDDWWKGDDECNANGSERG